MADCRMIAVYCKTQALEEIIKQLEEPVKQTIPLVEAQQKILEYNKNNLVKNELPKPEIATMLKNFESIDTALMNLQAKLNDVKQITQFVEKSLILHYQFS